MMAECTETSGRTTVNPGGDGGRFGDSPAPKGSAKVPGDRDEAKALPDDIAVNERGGPDADVHHPAAASTTADEEAGAASSTGRIEPLRPKAPPSGRA